MAMKSEPFYWLECDDCGEKSTAESDYSAFGDPESAIDDAREVGWFVDRAKDEAFCEDCRHKHGIACCPSCGELQRLADVEGGERLCEDCRQSEAEAGPA